MKLTAKLPFFVTGVSLCMALGVGVVGYITSAAALKNEAHYRLQSILETRAKELQGYLHSIEEDLRFVASNPATRQALQDFTAAWQELGNEPTQTLQRPLYRRKPSPDRAKGKPRCRR